jgi:hypothetical protein
LDIGAPTKEKSKKNTRAQRKQEGMAGIIPLSKMDVEDSEEEPLGAGRAQINAHLPKEALSHLFGYLHMLVTMTTVALSSRESKGRFACGSFPPEV